MAVWLLLVFALTTSCFAATAWQTKVRGDAHSAFNAQASDVATSITVALARVDDLTSTTSTLVGTHPDLTSRQWEQWFASLDLNHRYAGAIGLAYIAIVPESNLAAFAADQVADPAPGLKSSGPLTVVPAGKRPFYCIVRLGSIGAALSAVPPGLDLCAVSGADWMSKPRDTGVMQITPVVLNGQAMAETVSPVYKGGKVPSTVAGRRANVIGLIGGLFDVNAILRSAVVAHPGLGVQLLRADLKASPTASLELTPELGSIFGTARTATVGSVGATPVASSYRSTVAVQADGTWAIAVSASSAAGRHQAAVEALVVLALGLFVTALLCTLVLVLVRGRRRALQLVERRTSELKTSEGRFRSLASASPMGILQTDDAGRFAYGNERLTTVLGFTPEQMAGLGWLDAFTAQDRPRVLAALHADADRHPDAIDAQIAATREPRWVRFSAAPLSDDDRPSGFVASLEDVSAEVAAKIVLIAEARHDALTGLPNRVCFLDALQDALTEMPEHGGQVAVLFIDLDRFKQVNDAHGHAAGDELLIATAGRIAASLRPGDLLSRLGGDEFAVLMTGIDDVVTATAVVDRLQAAVGQPFAVAGAQTTVGASVGLVLVTEPGDDPATILQNADMAMYRAKAGSNRFEIFDSSLRESVQARLETEQALRGALDRDELRLVYQPIVELQTGRVAGGEALLRWAHPQRGLLLPGEFLPLAESTGLIVPIGDWVLRSAVQAALGWPEEIRLNVAVNFSAQQLASSTLLPQVEHLLATTAIQPRQLCVEVLETHLLDDANVRVLRDLKRLGVQVSIDDFGTGYSSLLYLKRLPADSVKIDRALIADITESREDRIIVTKVIELAHDLGIQVIAEGIERPGQAEILHTAGCDLAQGFLWSPGVPEPDFRRMCVTGLPRGSGVPAHRDAAETAALSRSATAR